MSLRISTIVGSFCALCLIANPGWTFQPFRSTFHAVHPTPSQAFRSAPFVGVARTNNVNIPHTFQHATTTPLRSPFLSVNAVNQSPRNAIFHLEKSLWNYDRSVLRYDLRHGYNPYGYSPYGYSPYGYNPYGYNAYSQYPYSYNPYAYGGSYSPYSYNPYSYGASPYYGGDYPQSASYGGYGSGMTPNNGVYQASYSPPNSEPVKGQADASSLMAVGIPNENGDVKWPLAFSALLPESKREIRQKLGAQLQILSTQAVINKANPNLAREASRSAEQLRVWLRGRQGEIAEGTYRDGIAFLRKVDDALDAMGAR